jgi:hypothetical protein
MVILYEQWWKNHLVDDKIPTHKKKRTALYNPAIPGRLFTVYAVQLTHGQKQNQNHQHNTTQTALSYQNIALGCGYTSTCSNRSCGICNWCDTVYLHTCSSKWQRHRVKSTSYGCTSDQKNLHSRFLYPALPGSNAMQSHRYHHAVHLSVWCVAHVSHGPDDGLVSTAQSYESLGASVSVCNHDKQIPDNGNPCYD